MDLLAEAKSLTPLLKEYRRAVHGIAEVGLNTPKTNALIEKVLKQEGVSYRKCGGGILCTLGEGEGGILLRADTDALPIKEESGLPFAAKGDTSHACGHDMHTAMLLGALLLLKRNEKKLSNPVTLMFQPAEEILKGACSMIEDGALEGKPRFAYGIHILTDTDIPTGTLLAPPAGTVTAASDFFSVAFLGRGAHGATPEKGCNPLLPAAHALLCLSGICATELSPEKQALLTVCRLEGARALNVIPSEVTLGGSFRTHDEASRAFLLERIPALCEALAAPFGVAARFSHEAHCPALQTDGTARAHALSRLKAFCADVPRKEIPPFTAKPRGGSEDFAYIAERIPAAFFSLAAGERKDGYCRPLHHSAVCFDENALPYGAAALAAFAL